MGSTEDGSSEDMCDQNLGWGLQIEESNFLDHQASELLRHGGRRFLNVSVLAWERIMGHYVTSVFGYCCGIGYRGRCQNKILIKTTVCQSTMSCSELLHETAHKVQATLVVCPRNHLKLRCQHITNPSP